MNQKCILVDGNVLFQKALCLYEDFSKRSLETGDTKPYTEIKGWSHRLRNRCRLRNIKIERENTFT